METSEYPLAVTSSEFGHMGYIPVKYTCDGENVNPPLAVKNIPAGAKSMALIMEDPEAENGTFNHWIMWNIHPHENIPEQAVSGVAGKNSAGNYGYTGPCPPGEGIHRYFFTIYILDDLLELDTGISRQELEAAIIKHTLSTATLVGLYRRAL